MITVGEITVILCVCVLVGGRGGGREGIHIKTHQRYANDVGKHTQKACQPSTCSSLILHTHKPILGLLLNISQLKSREEPGDGAVHFSCGFPLDGPLQ